MNKMSSESGAAAVEFAILVSVLALLLMGLFEYGQAVNLATELNSAARAGAKYAAVNPTDTDGIRWAAQNAAKDSITVTTPASGSTPYYCTCGDSGGTQISCALGKCTSPAVKKFFVEVVTSKTYTPLFSYPGFGSSIDMSGSAVVQFQ